jgi:hypothetical protein
MAKRKRVKLYPCKGCDFVAKGGPGPLGWHYKQNPSHRLGEQAQIIAQPSHVHPTSINELINLLTDAQLDDMFTYHAPTPAQLPKYAAVNEAAKAFAKVVIANTSVSADQSAAIRKIRNARMTANMAIALEGRY